MGQLRTNCSRNSRSALSDRGRAGPSQGHVAHPPDYLARDVAQPGLFYICPLPATLSSSLLPCLLWIWAASTALSKMGLGRVFIWWAICSLRSPTVEGDNLEAFHVLYHMYYHALLIRSLTVQIQDCRILFDHVWPDCHKSNVSWIPDLYLSMV